MFFLVKRNRVMIHRLMMVCLSCSVLFMEVPRATGTSGPDLRESVLLNEGWQIAVVSSLDQDAVKVPVLNGVKWEKVEVPYYGAWEYTWWQREFTVPDSMRDKGIKLRFEAVASKAIVFVNGKKAGEHFGGRMPFEIDITDRVRFGAPNQVLVGVINAYKAPAVFLGECDIFLLGANGIWDDVSLVTNPKVYTEDVWVIPSVRRKSLGLEITVRNESKEAFTGEVVSEVLDAGKPVKTFKKEPFSVGASKTAVLKFSYTWIAPVLWSPETPHLYHLQARILKGDKVVDRTQVRFGFREVWVEGDHMMLNGRRLNLRGDGQQTPRSAGPNFRELGSLSEQIQGLKDKKGNKEGYKTVFLCRKSLGLVYSRQHTFPPTPDYLDGADETGYFIQPEFNTAWGHDCKNPAPSVKDLERYGLPQYREWIKRDRNHPSVLVWGAENEYMLHYVYLHSNYVGAACNLLIRLNDFINSLDPTRWATFDGDGCLGGSLTDDGSAGPAKTINWHYQRGLAQGYTLFPNTCYWMADPKDSPGWSRKKPVWTDEAMDGEFIERWEPLTIFGGENIYKDPPPLGVCSWWPSDDGKSGYVAQAYSDAIRMQMEAWRYLGANWGNDNYWQRVNPKYTGDPKQVVQRITRDSARSCAPLAVIVKAYDHNFYSQESVARELTVYNDMFHDANLVLDWTLVDGDKVKESGKIPLSLPAGESKKFTVTLHLPKVSVRKTLAFRLKLQETGTANRFEEEKQYTVFPKDRKQTRTAARLAVFGPEKRSRRVLETLGLPYTNVPDPQAISREKFDVLIIGKNSLPVVYEVPGLEPREQDKALLKSLRRIEDFAAAGGRVIVLEQENISPSFLSMNLKAKESVTATMTFSIAPGHPAVKDLQPEDLKFWRGDHIVSQKPLLKPDCGSFTVLIESGTGAGLTVTPLMEIKKGKGTVLFSQLDLEAKCGKEPAADILIRNLATYAAQYPEKALGRAGIVAEPASPMASFLKNININAENLSGKLSRTGLALYPCLIFDGADKASFLEVQNNVELIKKYLAGGGRLLIHNLRPGGERIIESLTGAKLEPQKIAQNDSAWKVETHPLLTGLSNFELWYGVFQGGFRVQGRKAIDAGWRAAKGQGLALLDPGGLLVIPCGPGLAAIDQILWEGSDMEFLAKRERYISTLLTNLGVNVEPKEAQKSLYPNNRLITVDLRPYANMGFRDDVERNGKGGWSDEGNNDLKYFPVGKQLLQGILFDVIDPQTNNGKSCVEPFFMKDRTISGIKVGKKLEALYFLYGGTYTMAGPGDQMAFYNVIYADGQTVKVPIRYGIEINDWWSEPPESATVKKAWEGDNGFRSPIFITHYQWHNPRPEKEISGIDLVIPPASPCHYGLIAITGVRPEEKTAFRLTPTGKVKNGRNIKAKDTEVSYMRESNDLNIGDPKAEFSLANPVDALSFSTLTFTAEFEEDGWINLGFVCEDAKTTIATQPDQIKALKGINNYSIDLTSLKWKLFSTDLTAKLEGKVKTIWISTSQPPGSPVRLKDAALTAAGAAAVKETAGNRDPCAENLRRLGRAILEYARDHNGQLPSRGPHTLYSPNGNPTNTFTDAPDLWSRQILKYLKLPKGDYSVFHCPQVLVNGKPLAPSDPTMNYALVGSTQKGPLARMQGRFLSEIENPTGLFLLVEPRYCGNVRNSQNNTVDYWNTSTENGCAILDSLRFSHNGKAHFLFVDGHIELLGPKEISWPGKK
jgi:prepilin-type processing-associated H-X9-DG protein